MLMCNIMDVIGMVYPVVLTSSSFKLPSSCLDVNGKLDVPD